MIDASQNELPEAPAVAVGLPLPDRSIVMVGLMGAGKTAIGKRLAASLGLPFVDTDKEIEQAAGCSIPEIFQRYGEPAFRDGERRVIARLLAGHRCVLATGGGAFMDPETRAAIRAKGLSIWLKADLDTLVRRTARRTNRPLLNSGEPREILSNLMKVRYPVYAEADIHVQSLEAPADETAARVLDAVRRHLDASRRA
ncbi:MAG: shikimate kinase [Alphaproteobacteria bacterium]|nr:shikimate kinase [Alphaproteobacteria bacterium]